MDPYWPSEPNRILPYVFRQRLLKLVARLREVPAKQFTYNVWVGEDWQGKSDLSCGTSACALGWATTIPSLRKLGLHLEAFPRQAESSVVTIHPRAKILRRIRQGSRIDTASEASEVVFGLTRAEHRYLFVPSASGLDYSANARQVSAHIQDFVERVSPPKKSRTKTAKKHAKKKAV